MKTDSTWNKGQTMFLLLPTQKPNKIMTETKERLCHDALWACFIITYNANEQIQETKIEN